MSSASAMDELIKFLLVILCVSALSASGVSAATYSVLADTETAINSVSNKFLSFTVDPKFLFNANEDLSKQDLKYCMATALVPSYLRVAGPSTSSLKFFNYTITFTDTNAPVEEELPKRYDITPQFVRRQRQNNPSLFLDSQEILNKNIESFGLKKKRFEIDRSDYVRHEKLASTDSHPRTYTQPMQPQTNSLSVTYFQFKNFATWAQNTGFELVFALNNEKKMPNGLWDPNTALNILTFANNDNITKVYWQLGYECQNQSIDSYLNDLETLGAIIESFAPRNWKTIGGDISKCLSTSSKNDFRDYVILTDQMADAVVLDANSSAHELSRMAEEDRSHLLDLLAHSYTPLWLVDAHPQEPHFEFHRAVDWITSLGYSAKNGFSVHFRELIEDELYQPSLSFYMALLFKHLVGNRVLNVEMESSEAVLFAHCTSLHRLPVPGAMTVYGANLADETARFLVKLNKREEGGDIMQFILGNDLNGDVILNGKPITEVNIRPLVKHVRPYKTLLFSLPPKSVGFWVIANSKFNGCQISDDDNFNTAEENNERPDGKVKRSTNDLHDYKPGLPDESEAFVRKGINKRIKIINRKLQKIRKGFGTNDEVVSRRKREVDLDERRYRKMSLREILEKYRRNADESRRDYVKRILEIIPRSDNRPGSASSKVNEHKKVRKSKTPKKVLKSFDSPIELDVGNDIDSSDNDNRLNRTRRSILDSDKSDLEQRGEESSREYDSDSETENEMKLNTILQKIQEQMNDLSEIEAMSENEHKHKHKHDTARKQVSEAKKKRKTLTDSEDEELFVVKTKMADDGATIDVKQQKKRGLFWAFNNAFSVLDDLSNNINRLWSQDRDSDIEEV